MLSFLILRFWLLKNAFTDETVRIARTDFFKNTLMIIATFIAAIFALNVLYGVGLGILGYVANQGPEFMFPTFLGDESLNRFAQVAVLIELPGVLYYGIINQWRRMNDIGLPSAVKFIITILSLIPYTGPYVLISLTIVLFVFLCPGSSTVNQYGVPPHELKPSNY